MTDRTWFSHLLWQPASKWNESILTTPEPTRGHHCMETTYKLCIHDTRVWYGIL